MSKVFDFIDKDRKDFLKIKHEEAQRFIDPKTNKIFTHMVERIKCPVCNIDDSVLVFEKAGFDFVKCRGCGLLHVNPQLTLEVQDNIYKASKTADQWIKVQQNTKEQHWNAEKKFLPALNELKNLRPKGGRLLDIGCSIGQFLHLAGQFGWMVEGIELNLPASEIARSTYGLKVHNDKIENINFPETP